MHTNIQVSLVIPVYNEADRIADCLRAVAAQTIRPLEVIVVDNNSTDQTALIASRFVGVRVIRERRQGVVHARNRGFDAARGDIIARIDADTLLPVDWLATISRIFASSDVDAVSGAVTYRDIVLPRLVSQIDLFWRRRMARLLGPEVALQGANMALRRSMWQRLRPELCCAAGVHEDFDIAVHAHAAGYAVRFAEELTASVCYRQADYDLRSFAEYALISPRTYLAHGRHSGRHMYQVVWFVITLYPVISLLSHGYDAELERFSLARLFSANVPPRVNPATFVD